MPAYPDTKCSCRIIEKISIKFLRGALTIIIILVIFAGISLKLEKVVSFNPCPSLPSFITVNRKRFQCLNVGLNNKTEPLFLDFNECKDKF